MTKEALLGKKYCRRLLLVVAAGGMLLGLLALAAMFPTTTTNAGSEDYPKVIDRDSVAYGRTYSEWSAAWEQWAYSIDATHHPLFDTADCSKDQSGPVWFLGGKFCYNGGTCSYTGVVRDCSVPYGKALYFPVINGEDSALEESVYEHPGDESWQQITALRAYEDTGMSPANVYCYVDGAPIPQLRDRFRVQSTAFGFTIPTKNYLNEVYAVSTFLPGTYFPAVDDGWYVMLGQLRRGHHVLHFGGSNGGFALEITYHLTVGS
jgi:hypothetical protein